MPLLLIILAVLIVRGVTLPGSGAGVSFLVSPQWHALTPGAILTAMGHAFFTLSAGMGAMITYGSYLPDQTDMPGATVREATLDTVIAIAAGFAIFPAVFAFSMEPGQGPGLIFAILDMNWFDLVAHVVSDYMLPVGGLCMAVFVAWSWRTDAVLRTVSQGSSGFRALGLWIAMLRWVVPLVVAEVLLLGLLGELDPGRFPGAAALARALQPWLVALVVIVGSAAAVSGLRPVSLGGSEAARGT